jgi:hypothetical protein
MVKIKMKELEKFLKDNPDTQAALAIQEQLNGYAGDDASNMNPTTDVPNKFRQIRNGDSYLPAERVNQLHTEILKGMTDIFRKAITIGEILCDHRNSIEHGQWLTWIENHLTIGPRQVQNYIRIYSERKRVGFAMKELAEEGLKPSLRKMLEVATKKDNQTREQYIQNLDKDTSGLTAKQKREQRLKEKRDNEISTLAKLYSDKEIDDSALTALTTRWNIDNPKNTILYVSDVKKAVREMEQDMYPDIFNPDPALKSNITLSIDTEAWERYIKLGGCEAYLESHLNEYLEEYVNEQKSYRIAN